MSFILYLAADNASHRISARATRLEGPPQKQFYEDIGRHHPKITDLSQPLPALDIVLSGRRNPCTTLRKLFDSLALPESLRGRR